MNARSPWKEVGVFDRETRSYVVDRIPRAPEARAVVDADVHGRQTVVGHELKVGCPKCFEQMIVRWHQMYSDAVVRDFKGDSPDIMAVAVAQEMMALSARAEANERAARMREAEARENAARAEASFRRIQLTKSKRAARKHKRSR